MLETPQGNVYHAGETVPTATPIAALRDSHVDVCLLPVNGRDWFRERDGSSGNMDAREAVALTVELGARLLVPMHWDGLAGNTVDPETVVAEARRADAPRLSWGPSPTGCRFRAATGITLHGTHY